MSRKKMSTPVYVTNGDIHSVKLTLVNAMIFLNYMELETATEQVRLYPSTYKKLKEKAKKRHTSIAQIVLEELEKSPSA